MTCHPEATRRATLQVVVLLQAILISLLPICASAEPVDPAVARGKAVLYVSNLTKLEKARLVVPLDTKRVATLETWRRNDDKVVGYLQSLGFRVTKVDEHAPAAATRGNILTDEHFKMKLHRKPAPPIVGAEHNASACGSSALRITLCR